MPAPSLYQLTCQACIHNVKRIDDVGDAAYSIVRPFLIKMENPNQLRELEKNSPQIAEADAELWQSFIKRDVPNWREKMMEPKDPRNWWKVYRKLLREAEEELRAQGAALKAALSTQTAERAGQQMQFINKVVDPQKRSKPRMPTTASRTGNSSLLTFNRGTRTKMSSGKDVLERARREAREASMRGRGALTTPTHLLHQRAGQVRSVPKAMATGPPPVPAPARAIPASSALSTSRAPENSGASDGEAKRMYSVPRLGASGTASRRSETSSPAPQRSSGAAGAASIPPKVAGKKRPAAADFLFAPKRL